jgi:hypothetical protein
MFYVRFYKVALISINLLSSWLHAHYVILVSSSFNLITKKDAVPIIRNRIFMVFGMEHTGLEPVTFALPARRSPN